jgi:hypothetical protein
VMFLVPHLTPALPGQPIGGPAEPLPPSPGATREVGPFRVRALGNRLASQPVWAAANKPQLQENVIGIGVRPDEKQKAMALWDILQATNFRQVGIEKLGPPPKKR